MDGRSELFIGRSLIALVATAGLTIMVSWWLVPTTEEAGGRGLPGNAGHAGHHHADSEAIPSGAVPPNLAAQIAAASTVASRWPTAADALADGWTLAEDYAAHVGAHYMQFDEIDGLFDVTHPEMLLFEGDVPTRS